MAHGYKDKNGKFHPIGKKDKRSPRKKRQFEKSQIQSLVFNKKKFSITKAKEWASDHGFKAEKVEPTKNTLRIRQFSPNKIKRGGECRTITLGGSGVQGVLCEVPMRFAKDEKGSLRSVLKFPEKTPVNFDKAKKDIESDMAFREKLLDKNEQLAEKIEANPNSTFAESRKDQLKVNVKAIKEVENDIKKTINMLSKEQRGQLPNEVKNLRKVI